MSRPAGGGSGSDGAAAGDFDGDGWGSPSAGSPLLAGGVGDCFSWEFIAGAHLPVGCD